MLWFVVATCFPACIHNGTCVRPNKCECPKGYKGDHCQKGSVHLITNIVTSHLKYKLNLFFAVRCKSDCSGHGQCLEPNRCTCDDGFYGRDCNLRSGTCWSRDHNTCENGGTCLADSTCLCRNGYDGEFCQNRSFLFFSSFCLLCAHAGVTSSCKCLFTAICKKSCGAHGRCVAPNQCQCERGYRGRWCDKSKCRRVL